MRRVIILLCIFCLIIAAVNAHGSTSKGKGNDSKDKGKKNDSKDKGKKNDGGKSGGKSGGKGGHFGGKSGKGGQSAGGKSGIERFSRCKKQVGLASRSTAGQSFYSSCPDGFALRSLSLSNAKSSSGFMDTLFTIAYKKVTTQKQAAVKRRITKFCKSSETASIACSKDESMCGMLSDFDESDNSRYFAFECCDYSNAVSNQEGTREATKTVSLSQSKSAIRSTSSSQVIKNIKIVSMTTESVTYTVTYTSYHYEKQARFTESSTTEEFKQQSSSSSSNSSSSSSSSSSSQSSKSSKSSSMSSSSSKTGTSGSSQSSQSSSSTSESSKKGKNGENGSHGKGSHEHGKGSHGKGSHGKGSHGKGSHGKGSHGKGSHGKGTHEHGKESHEAMGSQQQSSSSNSQSESSSKRGHFGKQSKSEMSSGKSSGSSSNMQSSNTQSSSSQSAGSQTSGSQSSNNQSQSQMTNRKSKKKHGALWKRHHRKEVQNEKNQSQNSSSSSSTSSSSSSSSSSFLSVTDQRISSFKKITQNQKTAAEKSFQVSCDKGYAISKVTTSCVKTSTGKWDVIYQFAFSKITQSSEQQTAVKKRTTKFVKSSEFSSVTCSGAESMCGVLSDYDDANGRIYALQCCDNSNAKEDKEEKVTETVNLKEGTFKSLQAKSSSQVVKSIKIVSISSTTITYEVTYCSYSYTKESRFSSSSTVSEYKSQSSSSSSSGGGGGSHGKGSHGKGSHGKGSHGKGSHGKGSHGKGSHGKDSHGKGKKSGSGGKKGAGSGKKGGKS